MFAYAGLQAEGQGQTPPCPSRSTSWCRSTTRRPASPPASSGLHAYLAADAFPFTFQITIADNASTDTTWQIATGLADRLPHVQARHLDQKGRGRALRATWTESTATVLAYMDVDLSTDLAALMPLVAPLLTGHSDIAIGSRLSASSTGDARREARGHLPLLQPDPAHHASRPLLRRPVRLQGHSRLTRHASCSHWCRTTAGSSTPSCSCSASGPACVSTRCRSTGSMTPTAGSTSCRPPSPT